MIKNSKQKTKPTEIVFGIHALVELLKAKQRSVPMIYTTKPHPKSWDEIARLLPKYTQIQYVQRDVLHRLAGTTDHQGVVAYVSPFVYRKKFFSAQKERFILLLDGIQDPRNLGAILRTAYCTGVDGVILPEKNAAPLTALALKASAGLAEHMPIYKVPTVKAALADLEKENYTLYVSQLSPQAKRANEVEFSLPTCLVIGNEEVGVSKEVMQAGIPIILPQRSSDISYNASVAAGILLFLIATQCKKL